MALVMRSPSIAGLVLLCGCAITQVVTPVSVHRTEEVCIVKNDEVRRGFLDVYRNALEQKGFEVRVVEPGKRDLTCALTSTYRANWSWDLALYMSYAEIRVFEGSELVGKAEYDSTRGGANLGKFISAKNKVAELVEELFAVGP